MDYPYDESNMSPADDIYALIDAIEKKVVALGKGTFSSDPKMSGTV